VRVLALADKRPPLDPALMAEQMDVDAVVCLGDLDRAWIEPLRGLAVPCIGVHGNHDPPGLLREVEVDDLQGKRTSLGGLTFAASRAASATAAAARTTTRSARRRSWPGSSRRRRADRHCPPLGVNDDPGDPAHVGFEGLRDWVSRHRPRHLSTATRTRSAAG
jgi:Icc-related predicted phosphoesterase